jgi:hypothetical protein
MTPLRSVYCFPGIWEDVAPQVLKIFAVLELSYRNVQIVNMEAVSSPETSVTIYSFTRKTISEDLNRHQYRCGNPKSYRFFFFCVYTILITSRFPTQFKLT